MVRGSFGYSLLASRCKSVMVKIKLRANSNIEVKIVDWGLAIMVRAEGFAFQHCGVQVTGHLRDWGLGFKVGAVKIEVAWFKVRIAFAPSHSGGDWMRRVDGTTKSAIRNKWSLP